MTSFQVTTPAGAYLGFLSAIAIWGWIELAFLTGKIAGPITSDYPGDRPEWERFIRAWGTIAYHEMLLIAVLLSLFLVGGAEANQTGLWTFAVLFFARVSAKLNLYLGVPYINTEFIPRALAHLPSHFRTSRMNRLFPFSVTALAFATACWLERLVAAQTVAQTVSFSLLAAITALALLEHWLMVVPLPDAKLWTWIMPARKRGDEHLREG